MRSIATVAAHVPVAPDATYAVLGPADPSRFYGGFLAIPAVVRVAHQSGAWDRVGDHRSLDLSDGGSVTETVTRVDAPHRLAYRLTDFTGVFGALVDHADADWRFEVDGSGTRVVWRYAFAGKRGRGLVVAAIVRMLWAPYMHRVLPALVAEARRVASR